MIQMTSSITCIACSIFRSELEGLRASGEIDFPIRYVDSALHIYLDRLRRRLDVALANELDRGAKVLLLFGDCHPYMHDQTSAAGVDRVQGVNCPEILLGREAYRALRRQGAFFLMPEWTIRWREIFQEELGLESDVARDMMGEMFHELLYLDTGQIPIPTEHLEAFSEYTGLPWRTVPVEPDRMLAGIREALERIGEDEN